MQGDPENPGIPREDLTPAYVAGALGVTTGRVYALIKARRIPAIHEGRSIRIPRRAWEAWLRDRADAATNSLAEPL